MLKRNPMHGISKSCGCNKGRKPKYKISSGDIFNWLTAVEPVNRSKWMFTCACGSSQAFSVSQVILGQKKSCCRYVPDEEIRTHNIAGKKFNRLTAIEKIDGKMWKFRCDCGSETMHYVYGVLSGNIKSCGCKRFDRTTNSTNITGVRFGSLVAEKRVNQYSWLYRCDCGDAKILNEKNVSIGNVELCECRTANKSTRTDITGQKFGHLTAVARSVAHGKDMWLFQCVCGNTSVNSRRSRKLVWSDASCGCLQDAPEVDIAGKRFGLLTAVEYVDRLLWKFRCECGTEKNISKRNVVSGTIASCGCRKRRPKKTARPPQQLALLA
ncbi:hypothetical protein [Burkholderia anthina]|uniref:hypothetical protein n=1 Tax=Burkholderia anthina TaxID=179879 RepID=UPI0037C0DF08